MTVVWQPRVRVTNDDQQTYKNITPMIAHSLRLDSLQVTAEIEVKFLFLVEILLCAEVIGIRFG